MNDQKKTTIDLADKYMFKTYARFPLTLVRGEGCRVWDEDGKTYLDFIAGIAVCALGHCSPIVTEALEHQSKELVHVSNLYYTRPQTELARLLVENSFADRVFFCNSGAEANEGALKVATALTGRSGVVAAKRAFHGRTLGAVSLTSLPHDPGDPQGLPRHRGFGHEGRPGCSGAHRPAV